MEADRKREMILEKALLRFAHFGIQKTTMNEIAEDLSISKPLVYYYFPDKVSLVVAVVDKILKDYEERVTALFEGAGNSLEAVFTILELKNDFFQKYFMLHLIDLRDAHLTKDQLQTSISRTRAKEVGLLKNLFERAVNVGLINVNDPAHTAGLFLDMLTGIAISTFSKQEKQLIPDSKGFEEVLLKQKELTRIFLNGIKLRN